MNHPIPTTTKAKLCPDCTLPVSYCICPEKPPVNVNSLVGIVKPIVKAKPNKRTGGRGKCQKTVSGKHKWIGEFDGFEQVKYEGSTMIGVPRVVIKCQACGLYDY